MIIRKMRRMRRKGTVRRRRTRRRMKNKAEVKYCDINLVNGSISTQNLATAARTLYQINGFGPTTNEGILAAIGQGAGNGQRIGNKILVKAISIHTTMWICPDSTDTVSYDSVLVRYLAHTAPVYFGGSDVTDFWSSNITTHIHDFPRLANYKVYLDKTLSLQASTPVTGVGRTGKGNIKNYKFTLKYRNKPVEYKDGSTSLKYQADRICLNAIAFSPSVANNVQLVCQNVVVRIYFTDP